MTYKYCPKCGGGLKERANSEGNEHPTCADCGFIFYQNSKPCAGIVITNDKNEVLLVKRAIEPYLGKWDIPGGFLENGEELMDGAKREAKEELGIDIKPTEILTIFVDKYGYEEGDLHTFNVFIKAEVAGGEITLDDENSDYGWFSADNIPWEELAFRNTEITVKTLYKLPGGRPLF